jgi:hypothetical protein
MDIVLKSGNIKTEAGRRCFLQNTVARFDQEVLLAGLKNSGDELLNPDEIHELAGKMVASKNEDEILAEIGTALPPEAIALLLKVDQLARRGLTTREVLYLPGEAQIMEKAQLGRTTFSSIKRIVWRSLCDPESDLYKAWFNSGLQVFLDRKYIAGAVVASLAGRGISIRTLAISATALIIKFGIEVYCYRYRPDFLMEARMA